MLCFSLVAPAAPVLGRRLGVERALLAALVPIAVGLALRGFASTWTLFAGTLLVGAGIAVGNVIVPAVLKARFHGGVGVLTGLYTAALAGGAALAAGLTLPVERALDTGWAVALAIWAIPAAVALTVVAAASVGVPAPTTVPGERGRALALLGDPLAWQVTLFMGLQSLLFYACLAWLPSILRDSGYSPEGAGGLLALYAVGGIPASLVVSVLAVRSATQGPLATAAAALSAAGLAGLLAAPEAAVLWVLLLAIAQGGSLGLALLLIVLRSPDAHRAAELSAMAQAIGYGLAATGPVAAGLLHDASGDWTLPLAVLLALTAPLLASGLGAGRRLLVGDTPARVTA